MNIIDNSIHPQTESDVEQQVILPFLKSRLGLGLDDSDFISKPNIKKIRIGKGKEAKLYFPDYVVIIDGIPSLIIEAKSPGADLNEALREARLYATEINSDFPSEINPCAYILASNGDELIASHWDTVENIVVARAELNNVNEAFENLVNFISKTALHNHARVIKKKHTAESKLYKPVDLLGGISVRNESVGDNSFGSNISVEYRYLFNPENKSERKAIIENAYVESKRRNSHISPIDKIVRAAVPRYMLDSTDIDNSKSPIEITDRLINLNTVKNEICILIGTVGSGKSTFADYLRLKGLPSELRSSTQWLSINLNRAPISKDIIYEWVADQLREQLESTNLDIDYNQIAILKAAHHKKIEAFKKGIGSLFEEGSNPWNEKLASLLESEISSKFSHLKALIQYTQDRKKKYHIIVLDNCDKRNRAEQLLMFELATWLKSEYPCTVFLPMRDTTYEGYHLEPPLDTVIKDLVFRIDPPLLKSVLSARLKYATRLTTTQNSEFSYNTSSGMRVTCTRGEVSRYLQCIINSLFQDGSFGRIITGLAGRNIRLGLELVLNFCKSGHLLEEEILKIRMSDGSYKVSPKIISRILFKSNRRYYSDETSTIKNLFCSFADDAKPNPLCRLHLLQFLDSQKTEKGPNGIRGYKSVSDTLERMQLIGHDSQRCILELNYLTESELIISESLNKTVEQDDLVKIGSAGTVHLDLVKDLEYLSTVAEDTYFYNKDSALTISKNISGQGKFQRYSHQTDLDNAITLGESIIEQSNTDLSCLQVLEGSPNLIKSSHKTLTMVLEQLKTQATNDKKYSNLNLLLSEYPAGSTVEAVVVSIKQYGIFVEFGLNGSGRIHRSAYGHTSMDLIELLEEGDTVLVTIIEYSTEHSRFQLSLESIPDLDGV